MAGKQLVGGLSLHKYLTLLGVVTEGLREKFPASH